MHQPSTARVRSGPFLIQPRIILVVTGLLAIVTGLIHLIAEIQLGQVTLPGAVLVVILSQVLLAALFFAWRGRRFPIAIAGLLAFAEFGNQASTHFVIGVNAIEFMVPTQGIGFAVDLLVLEVACLLCALSAIICVSNPFGRSRRMQSFPFLLLAIAGASALVLHAADDIGRRGFGSLSIEDGLMVASITAGIWLIGALWMAGSPTLGSLLVVAASANVVVPFITLHLLPGAVSVEKMDAQSGIGAALIAAVMAVLAAASLIGALVWLLVLVAPRTWGWLTAAGKRRQAEAKTRPRSR